MANTRRYECNLCQCTYKQKQSLKRHQLKQHGVQTRAITSVLQCNICEIRLGSSRSLSRHMKEQHSRKQRNEYWLCFECNTRFKTKRCLKQHLNRHVVSKRCVLCNTLFKHSHHCSQDRSVLSKLDTREVTALKKAIQTERHKTHDQRPLTTNMVLTILINILKQASRNTQYEDIITRLSHKNKSNHEWIILSICKYIGIETRKRQDSIWQHKNDFAITERQLLVNASCDADIIQHMDSNRYAKLQETCMISTVCHTNKKKKREPKGSVKTNGEWFTFEEYEKEEDQLKKKKRKAKNNKRETKNSKQEASDESFSDFDDKLDLLFDNNPLS
eukprot:182112_1